MTARYVVTSDGEPILETDSIRIARAQYNVLGKNHIVRIHERTYRGQTVELDGDEVNRRVEYEIREQIGRGDL